MKKCFIISGLGLTGKLNMHLESMSATIIIMFVSFSNFQYSIVCVLYILVSSTVFLNVGFLSKFLMSSTIFISYNLIFHLAGETFLPQSYHHTG